MNKKQKQELKNLEKRIMRIGGQQARFYLPKDWTEESKIALKELLGKRKKLLNEMFECNQTEVECFRRVNELLYNLSKKMHSKALNLYQSLLKEGYDPDFDDDITLEASLRFFFNNEIDSIINESEGKNTYGSKFNCIMDILYDLYDDECTPECAFCQTSYSLGHHLDMPASELGLDFFLDDGSSWDETPLDRPEFKDICICHAIHDLCSHKLFSIPDLLIMNDFRIDISITHQHRVNQNGKRVSFIK